VLGLVGTNGIGKSTALKILAGKEQPNLGRWEVQNSRSMEREGLWRDVMDYFRGSELQAYFGRIAEGTMRVLIKPQYVDQIPRAVQGSVGEVLSTKRSNVDVYEAILDALDLRRLLDRNLQLLSGGELQRFAIAVVAIQDADTYMFDEPSSYLDIKQRLSAAHVIRDLVSQGGEAKYVLVVEHDLAVLDYLSDIVCCLYGVSSAYGVVTLPYSVREGINIFLAGFVPTENLRFRTEAFTFYMGQRPDVVEARRSITYPAMTKTMTDETSQFTLHIEAGSFTDSSIIVLLGENGMGKTTFIRMLAGLLAADEPDASMPQMSISYKPQRITPRSTGTVWELLQSRIHEALVHPQFKTDVLNPMNMDAIRDHELQNLSGGELQRVALVLALGTPADLYLFDEPSAYLDAEQRIIAAKVIRRFILHTHKTAFVVEHDFIMATYLADRVIVYDGTPAVESVAHAPQSLVSGMNAFLRQLQITFRRDPTNHRPRINKLASVKDREQKESGNYFYDEDDDI